MSGKRITKLYGITPYKNNVCSFNIGDPEKAVTERALRRMGSKGNTFSEYSSS